jgi:hypothetical protein
MRARSRPGLIGVSFPGETYYNFVGIDREEQR